MKMKSGIRILLVDDHQMLRDGLTALINGEENMTVSGQAATGEEALKFLHENEVDVVIMDISLQGMSGLEAIKLIRKRGFDTRIIVLSMHNDQEIISQAFKAGSNGFVPKSTAHEQLLSAIRAVASGIMYMHPASAAETISKMAQQHSFYLKLGQLSHRELEVCTLTARGYTRTEISQKLTIKPKTVDTYRSRVMEKLELSSRAQLVEFAINAGLLANE